MVVKTYNLPGTSYHTRIYASDAYVSIRMGRVIGHKNENTLCRGEKTFQVFGNRDGNEANIRLIEMTVV